MMTIKDGEIVWANPFGLDVAKWDQAEADPIPGLEVTELRTTAPTTMRRWDQYFAPDAAYEGFRFKDWKPSDGAVIEPAATATLANGMTVRGTQEWVDKMVAYYGKKAEPEASFPKFELSQADCDRLSKSLASRTIDVPEELTDKEVAELLLHFEAQPEPKRSPNAKPALPSLSIEAPLGNRYGGIGWCDE